MNRNERKNKYEESAKGIVTMGKGDMINKIILIRCRWLHRTETKVTQYAFDVKKKENPNEEVMDWY